MVEDDSLDHRRTHLFVWTDCDRKSNERSKSPTIIITLGIMGRNKYGGVETTTAIAGSDFVLFRLGKY